MQECILVGDSDTWQTGPFGNPRSQRFEIRYNQFAGRGVEAPDIAVELNQVGFRAVLKYCIRPREVVKVRPR